MTKYDAKDDTKSPNYYSHKPGTGAFVAAATTAAGRDPIILGKPSTYMFEALTITHPEVKPDRTLMIGDK